MINPKLWQRRFPSWAAMAKLVRRNNPNALKTALLNADFQLMNRCPTTSTIKITNTIRYVNPMDIIDKWSALSGNMCLAAERLKNKPTAGRTRLPREPRNPLGTTNLTLPHPQCRQCK